MNPSVQVGETRIELEFADHCTVADAIAAMASAHIPDGEVIGAIFLNDIYWQPEWEDELSSLPVVDVTSIRVETLDPTNAASDGLRDLEQILDLATSRFERAAEDLRFGDHAKGLLVFAAGADLLRDAMHFVELYADHERLGAGHPAIVMAGQAEVQVVQALPAFEQAQAAGDWEQLADVVEYEVAAAVDRLRSARTALEVRPVARPPLVLGAA